MEPRSAGGVVVVLGAGAGLLLLYAGFLVTGRWSVRMLLFAAPAPLLLAAGLLYTVGWVSRNGVEGRYVLRIGGWLLLGIVLLGIAGGLTVAYQSTRGVVLADRPYLFVNWATGGAFIGLLIGLYDSQRKRREQRLVEEREASAELNRRLSVLNRVLRHDLRNALTVILGQIDRVSTDVPEHERAARTIEGKCREILELSEKIRRFQSAIGGEGRAAESIDVVEVVARLIETFEAEYPDAEIRTTLPDAAPVWASELIQFAIRNVVENAIEHNDTDHPTVEITVATADDRDDRVRIRVADDGPGLPPWERAVIEQGHEKPLEHSSGLGLWLVTWIVEDAGGEIDIAPNEPRGTVLTLELPAASPSSSGSVANRD